MTLVSFLLQDVSFLRELCPGVKKHADRAKYSNHHENGVGPSSERFCRGTL